MEDLSEEERLEALHRWWKTNKQSAFLGVLLGLAMVGAWNMWQNNRRGTVEQASNLYQQLLKASEARQTDPALKLSERLIEQYGSTSYAEYARLFLAKAKADKGDLAGAKQALEQALAKSHDDNLKALARLRLGRALLAGGETDVALKLIEPVTEQQTGKLAGLYEELKGDLYAAAKRPADARLAYGKAKELGENSPLLELKLNDLPGTAN
ncbi:Putative negative regulator of RcsB-dependent stress response [Methylomagnum ishizawai]|uniref:Ancillary SecYEG translocon subunit n=1 Tax=Methylomagnum ishizawai TaxID=1760988 RepID=A0A1Y6CT94_9GAMM|nr:tetratricopeptide repeat protein [Methylomagnum ishizawai]SMF93517.1 Putative negative regulator of RcsB-dependent stress response [Methylomagnum ishizawai]